jgi:sugar phosphate isomerase/epimerase
LAERSIEELIKLTHLDPKIIAVETVDFPFKFMRKIVDERDLSICLDTGHLLAGYSGSYTVMEFLEENIDRIIDIHLHDGYHKEAGKGVEIAKDHLPLGEGKLPITDMFDFLSRNHYSHPIVFELTLSQATRSLDVIREHYPDALKR